MGNELVKVAKGCFRIPFTLTAFALRENDGLQGRE